MSDAPLTVGTAGHIDHGKTALIAAMTGTNTDRLPQERQRGISIELGYARLDLPSGRILSVIDVPGHERFVRTMVAGATGIDLYLMTVAADDGVMPQTREHAAVLAALGVRRGVVAITKCDLADSHQAATEAAELLPEAEIVPVCARTGEGLQQLAAALDRVAAESPSRAHEPGATRLHIDRAFTIRGAGTVVTGTLWSGSIARGDQLAIVPRGLGARVRSVQVHDRPTERALAGQRVAVNLTGVGRDEVSRGDVLTDGDLRATYLIDAQLEIDAEYGDRVQVHHGTRETPARLAALGGSFWQLRLEQPLIPAAGDRLVIRRIAPPDTLGGGVVLDPHPRKHGPSRDGLARLSRLARGEAEPEPARPSATPEPEPAPLSASALELEQRLKQAAVEPPSNSGLDPSDLAALRAAKRAVRVSKSLHYHPDTLEMVRETAVRLANENGGGFKLAEFRDALNTSRKFAQALLDHLDSERVTIRRGDEHRLRGQRP